MSAPGQRGRGLGLDIAVQQPLTLTSETRQSRPPRARPPRARRATPRFHAYPETSRVNRTSRAEADPRGEPTSRAHERGPTRKAHERIPTTDPRADPAAEPNGPEQEPSHSPLFCCDPSRSWPAIARAPAFTLQERRFSPKIRWFPRASARQCGVHTAYNPQTPAAPKPADIPVAVPTPQLVSAPMTRSGMSPDRKGVGYGEPTNPARDQARDQPHH